MEFQIKIERIQLTAIKLQMSMLQITSSFRTHNKEHRKYHHANILSQCLVRLWEIIETEILHMYQQIMGELI